MIVGIPKEIKEQEFRVGLTPAAVAELVNAGHDVFVESQAGAKIGFSDAHYQTCGATIKPNPSSVWSADLIVKVKEPQKAEYPLLGRQQILFTYLHLAAAAELTATLQARGTTAIAYETVTGPSGDLPLLTPMSEIAGRYAIQAAARCLESPTGGNGLLMAGVAGVLPARVLILGGGVVGLNAARMAIGLGASVTIVDRSIQRLRTIDNAYHGTLNTLAYSEASITEQLANTDVIVGAALVAGATAPVLIQRDHLKRMRPGTVLIDVAIDQGGCFATSKPTTHQSPTFEVDGIIHYCVANMPGAVALTATQALSAATLPYVLNLANRGLNALIDPGLQSGLNTYDGHVTHAAVANSLSLPFTPSAAVLNLNP